MAIKVSGQTVIDDAKNIVNIGSIQHKVIELTANPQVIDLTKGVYFKSSLSNSITTGITFTSPPSAGFFSFMLELDNYGASSVSWPANIKWAGGSVPTLISNNKHVYSFVTTNGGSSWIGSAVMNITI